MAYRIKEAIHQWRRILDSGMARSRVLKATQAREPRLGDQCIRSSHFAHISEKVHSALPVGPNCNHLDVMDHRLVPKLKIGQMVIAALLEHAIHADGTRASIKVHLIATSLDELPLAFIHAGADSGSCQVDKPLQLAEEPCALSILGLDSSKSLGVLPWLIDKIETVLIKGVNSGSSDQQFIDAAIGKLQEACQLINRCRRYSRLELNDDVNIQITRRIADAGAKTFVSGSDISGTPGNLEVIEDMRAALASHDSDAKPTRRAS
ncbi:ribulose-phosphate 3-epimerase [Acidovorax sp. A1169]|uniref:ribulose-phosphate 3-epimerase n=1 Tax=Acidovorax sp. A1169 TaxID=3059524 RepID=UPI0027378117|nr:ribulose-phosphate 3-epimerase [Acidovorax sp. A1169]MDP4078953.1 ribulose-phosphate 3-epimerase [Acidovorax sp. A1169]